MVATKSGARFEGGVCYLPEKQFKEFRRNCEEVQLLKDQLKAWSMIYQADDKLAKAKILGIPFEKVNIYYKDWSRIRNLVDEALNHKGKKRKLLLDLAREIAANFKRDEY